jgi:hypothetical protein
MSEQTVEQAPADSAPEAPEAEPQTFDADYVKKLRAESAKYRTEAKANADAAKRLTALEESQKTEAQKLAEARDAAEKRATDAERANLRYRVAVQKQLPPELVDRLRGETEEEMAADADALLTLVKPAAPSYDGGARTTAGAPADMNALIRRHAGRG